MKYAISKLHTSTYNLPAPSKAKAKPRPESWVVESWQCSASKKLHSNHKTGLLKTLDVSDDWEAYGRLSTATARMMLKSHSKDLNLKLQWEWDPLYIMHGVRRIGIARQVARPWTISPLVVACLLVLYLYLDLDTSLSFLVLNVKKQGWALMNLEVEFEYVEEKYN